MVITRALMRDLISELHTCGWNRVPVDGTVFWGYMISLDMPTNRV